ncbi:MAG: type IX secretion system sortase PorU [Bacteroidales bacterium]|nr:type IX secretion system sortase PorU [Bacteroidales bacterium]
MKKLAVLVFSLLPFISFSQQNSVLSSGDWYKLAVEETGVYKITYNNLQTYGIDVDNIDPRNLAIYGKPSGMLPELLEEPHYTDLQPMAIQVIGEEDGVFDPDDYILFYGQGPVIWKYDADFNLFRHEVNLYTEQTNYFLTVSDEAGKRIQIQQNETLPPNKIIDTLELLIYHENEWVNPGKTGKIWLGELFEEDPGHDFNFNLEDYSVYPDGHQFYTRLAAQSLDTNFFSIALNTTVFDSIFMPRVSNQNRYQLYKSSNFESNFNFSGNTLTVAYSYVSVADTARAWLDYFEMILKTKPVFAGNQMPFRSVQNIGEGNVSLYVLSSAQAGEIVIWNVTDPVNVSHLELNTETDSVWFKIKNDSLLEFYAFNGNTFESPEFVGQVENQNLHAFESPDLLIVSHPDFLSQAHQLALFHQEEDGMSVGTFTPAQIYNEFSSGVQDVTAIRNFVRYLWEQSDEEKPKYVLLFGDASYDYLNRVENNSNFVPTFETQASSNSIFSYAADDFFGLKNMTGNGNVKSRLAVGRIPVSTVEDANNILNKIQTYNSNNALGPWLNDMMFIGDDGDGNLHLKDVESLSKVVDTASPVMNISKCYLDFFELMQTEDGPRYPEANSTITNKMSDGVFYVSYAGHGGKEQLAHERILSVDDLSNWTNKEKLPLWVIGSGDVAYYDDPGYTSLGESVFLKDEAGAIAVLGSARATYASANLAYTLAVIKKLTDQSLQNELRFGDLMMGSTGGTSDSKWTLLGDPALKIHFPKYNVNTTSLNGIAIAEFSDTIPPGSYLAFQGEILSKDEGILQAGFNGTVYLKVFAPFYIRTTRANQEGSFVQDIEVQDSILTEGTATIENGVFEITVKLPTNYFEGFGNLKLSWYAENGETDANGYYNQLWFGGEPDAIAEGDEFLDQIKVYPTVFSNQLNIELPENTNKKVVYRIYNTVGVEVFSANSTAGRGTESIRIPGLAKGMYILNIDVADNSRNFKVFRY